MPLFLLEEKKKKFDLGVNPEVSCAFPQKLLYNFNVVFK